MRKLSAILEDYLEAILGLIERKGAARARDIAQGLAVHRSTVTAALKSLAGKGLVRYSRYELVTLTGAGRAVAVETSRKHREICRFLIDTLHLDAETADRNACRMEHAMDRAALERLLLFRRFIERQPALATGMRGFAAFARRSRKERRA
jgi:DtxR family Mn-dependent transcriptional regulator